ncbi:M4 family metallopeptidase [Nonomuraea typhae]|uniref:M4 family metallopeptidase n=1 Tax=Nonomuraea typhae TaxID=2603600 RepID=UPI0012F9A7DF|nr:M4 family metallopeptidase [Nonomuraea typhae]
MNIAIHAAAAVMTAMSLAPAPARTHAYGYHNGTVMIDVTLERAYHSLVDPLRPGISCAINYPTPLKMPMDVPIGVGRPWGRYNTITACGDLMYGVQRMWDMLHDWLGRDGIDGAGGGVPARVAGDPPAPAPAPVVAFVFRRDAGNFPTGLDLVGHEYGHVVYRTTPGGAGEDSENLGIGEGSADIFGTLTEGYANNAVDRPDYVIGESLELPGGLPLRHTFDPGLDGHPPCYGAQIPGAEAHAASGPLRHWFYLLAEGNQPGGGKPPSPICAGGPASVSGVGLVKAGRVFMESLLRKTPTWRYADVRAASVASALDLYGPADPACVTVKAAWDAVSVPAEPTEPAC